MTDSARGWVAATNDATQGTRRLVVLCYALIVAILLLDWITTAGVVVGVLLSIPIVLISMLGRPKPVLVATAVALIGYAIAAALGRTPILPPSVWIPNRVLVTFGIVASGAIALMVQRHRRAADDSIRAALSARDTNRLLMSLMAHDLRAPLVAASQALEYVERSAATGAAVDAELVGDTRLRLRRNLRLIEEVLHVARSDMRSPESYAMPPVRSPVSVAQEIEREAASFASEAEASGKQIVVRADGVRNVEIGLDALLLRQVLAILLDNAIRHAQPGPVWVDAELSDAKVKVSVTDSGPGLSTRQAAGSKSAGAGIGLELCRALTARAGGSLDLEQDSEQGTRFSVQLPVAAQSRSTWEEVLAVAEDMAERAATLTARSA